MDGTSVGEVAEQLAVAAPTLRTWERRYGLGPSERTPGGHRRYSRLDIARLGLMRRLVSKGLEPRTAADIARNYDGHEPSRFKDTLR